MTKIADLRSQTTDQLSDELLKLKKEQFNPVSYTHLRAHETDG